MVYELSDLMGFGGISFLSCDVPVHIILKINKCASLSAVDLPVSVHFIDAAVETRGVEEMSFLPGTSLQRSSRPNEAFRVALNPIWLVNYQEEKMQTQRYTRRETK